MANSQASLGRTLLWGVIATTLYGFLFYFADDFLRLAHTTQDACMAPSGVNTDYFNKATQDLCAGKGGTFINGTWWYVLAPIAMALILSYSHGMFTGLFWDLLGLKAKK
ncbi:MAG: hypothetical protein A2514_10760 [Gammaproteobacteria bacterium RIFOXYD12_FULL_61_37]|nr:MAG: hypothetical protein A2514_10760 [Gammaproteobacteria bacterium RIFOXYD12_FULL_61_37]